MNTEEKPNVFEKTTETIGWIQIFLSPFIIGLIIAAIIYFPNPNTFTLIIASAISALGFVIGARFASKIQKKEGTINFISKIDSTPELDENLKNKEK